MTSREVPVMMFARSTGPKRERPTARDNHCGPQFVSLDTFPNSQPRFLGVWNRTKFYYDALMRRHAIQDSSGLAYFTWDANGMNLLCERDASGSVVAEYTHGYAPVDGIGSGVGQKLVRGGSAYHEWDAARDHRGSVCERVDQNGNKTGSFNYNAWGVSLQDDETGAETRFRYQSNWIKLKDDPDGDTYLSPTRLYRAGTGIFLQRDGLGDLAGGYQYGSSEPVSTVDPDGETEAPAPGTKQKPKKVLKPTPKPKVPPKSKRRSPKSSHRRGPGLIRNGLWRVRSGDSLSKIWRNLVKKHKYTFKFRAFIGRVKASNPGIDINGIIRPGQLIRFDQRPLKEPEFIVVDSRGYGGACAKKWAIRSIIGGGATFGAGGLGIGGGRIVFQIKIMEGGFEGVTSLYHLAGMSASASVLPIDYTMHSSWTEFTTKEALTLADFEGAVTLSGGNVAVVGVGGMAWTSGKAKGAVAKGVSWGGNFDVGVSVMKGRLERLHGKGIVIRGLSMKPIEIDWEKWARVIVGED
jgi:RHS repeat-associated protein